MGSTCLLEVVDEGVNCYIDMFYECLVVFLILSSYFDLVLSSTAPLLFNLCRESEHMSPTTRIVSLIASINEFRLLRMVSAVHELVSS